jgi:hypothetical protein
MTTIINSETSCFNKNLAVVKEKLYLSIVNVNTQLLIYLTHLMEKNSTYVYAGGTRTLYRKIEDIMNVFPYTRWPKTYAIE